METVILVANVFTAGAGLVMAACGIVFLVYQAADLVRAVRRKVG